MGPQSRGRTRSTTPVRATGGAFQTRQNQDSSFGARFGLAGMRLVPQVTCQASWSTAVLRGLMGPQSRDRTHSTTPVDATSGARSQLQVGWCSGLPLAFLLVLTPDPVRDRVCYELHHH